MRDEDTEETAARRDWTLRIVAVLWFLLAAGCLLSLPVLFDASAVVVIAIALLAILLGALIAALYRRLARPGGKSFRRTWFASSLATFFLLAILCASPFYYFAISSATDPALLPKATLSNGEKTVVFQGMVHIGSERFYKQVIYDAEEALSDGAVLYYEGVQPNPAGDAWFSQMMAGGGDLSDNYRALAEICGLKFQLGYFDLLAKDKALHPASHITADVDTLQLKQEYDRLMRVDPAFATAMKADAAAADDAASTQGVTQLVAWLRKGSAGQRKLAGFACRWTLGNIANGESEATQKEKVILDFRNRAVVDRIVAEPNPNIYITYGARHLKGVLAELQARDPKWALRSISWIRPIEPPETFEREL